MDTNTDTDTDTNTDTNTISESTTITVHDECLSTTIDGETVILHVDSGTYYGLNEVATYLWDALEHGRSVAELRDDILEEYDVSPERCERDLESVLTTMAEADLIEIGDG